MAYRKYKNQQCEAYGIVFASISERDRYFELVEMQQKGLIDHLECHPEFELLPAFKDCEGVREKAITYCADFRYRDVSSGRVIVEDVKSKATHKARDWSLRKKLFKTRFPSIALREVVV